MKTQEWRSVDKSAWPHGEWDGEPDKVQWTTAAGLPALIVRGPLGALCGYVGVAEGHRYFGVDYGEADVEVHGGLTFSDFCQPHTNEGTGICHTPDVGEPDRVWWLGFDCAHFGDRTPMFDRATLYGPDDTYRNLAYVRNHVETLAAQLANLPIESRTDEAVTR